MSFRQARFFFRPALLAALALSTAVSAVRAADPAILSKLPADAYGLLVVNNVRMFSNRLSNHATRLNIPIPPDLVGYLTRNLGIKGGFDANSSAAIVMLKPSADRLEQGYFNGPPPMVALLPTTDPKAMLEPFQPGEPDKDGISQVTMPNNPDQKGFVATVDNKWVVLAQSHEDLAAYVARTDSFASKASPEVRKIFENNDIVLWGNVAKLGAGVDKQLDEAQTEVGGMMDLANVANNQDPIASAFQKQFITMGFGFLKEFLNDAGSSMLTVRMTDTGATFGLVGDFKPKTPLGKLVAAQTSVKPVTLAGLPTSNAILAAGAANWDSASLVGVADTIIKQVMSDPTISADPRAEEFKKSFELQKQLLGTMTGMRMILVDPPAGGAKGFLNGVAIMETTDPAKTMALYIEGTKSMLAQQSMNPDLKQTVTIVADEKTVKGVKLSKFTMKFELREETPDKPLNQASRMGLQMIQRAYGPDGLTAYFGVVGTHLIMIYGSDDTMIESAITAAQGNTDALSAVPAIAAMKDQIVANPIAVMYLPVTRWVTLAHSIMVPGGGGEAGLTPGILNAPPAVVSVGVSGSMITEEVHVPVATVSGVQEAIKRLEAAMMGGQPAGGALP